MSTKTTVYTTVREGRLTGSLARAWSLKGTSPSAVWRIDEVLRGSIGAVTPTSLIVAGAPMIKIEFANFKLCYDQGQDVVTLIRLTGQNPVS